LATNVGATPPDYSTLVGQVRAVIGDTDSVDLIPPVAGQGEYLWYGDAAITGLLTVYGENPKRAAAQALRTVASSQALILKKFSTDDLTVDGPAIAEALRKLAKDLDDQANGDEANVDIFELSYFKDYTLHPELAAFNWGQRYGLVEIGDGGYSYEPEGTQDGGLLG
jgi:hypothetical protein